MNWLACLYNFGIRHELKAYLYPYVSPIFYCMRWDFFKIFRSLILYSTITYTNYCQHRTSMLRLVYTSVMKSTNQNKPLQECLWGHLNLAINMAAVVKSWFWYNNLLIVSNSCILDDSMFIYLSMWNLQ
jgi:hypothetical protein